jgi:hypothetical protein
MAENGNNNGANIGSGTVAGLLAFLDWVVKKNYATPAAITPLKSAAKQVFETVESDNADDLDVRSLDLEEYFSRFQVAMAVTGRITPDSVRAYRVRFNRALAMYEEYLTTNSVPRLKARGSSKKPKAKVTTRNRHATPDVPATEPEDVTVVVSSMISFPFPLENGEVANLRLPKRLERRDAARLTAFINALTVDSEPPKQLPAAPEQ